MSSGNAELLFDLARLLRRHPPQAWDELIRLLENPRTRAKLIFFVQQMSVITQQARYGPPARETEDALQDFERAMLMKRLRAELGSRPLTEIRAIADMFGADVRARSSKRDAIEAIIDTLKPLSSHDIKKRFQLDVLVESRSPGQYQRWADLIMGARYRK